MSDDEVVSRRATDPRGELAGSVSSAAMAVLFAAVVIFGQAGVGREPAVRDAGDPVRGQSLLLLCARAAAPPAAPARRRENGSRSRSPARSGTDRRRPSTSARSTTGAPPRSRCCSTRTRSGSCWSTIGLDRKAPPRALFLALALALIGAARSWCSAPARPRSRRSASCSRSAPRSRTRRTSSAPTGT